MEKHKKCRCFHTGYEGLLKDLMSMEIIILCGLRSGQSPYWNTYGSGATGETALSTTVPKILNEGVLFGRMLFIPPAEFHTLLESITSSFEAALHFSHQLK